MYVCMYMYICIYIYIYTHVHPFSDPILIPLSWLKSHHVAWSPKWGQKLCRLGPASQIQKQLRQNVEILQVGFPHCLGLKGIKSLCLSGKSLVGGFLSHGVPPNHPFIDGFSIIENHPAIGGISMYGNTHM